MDASTQALCMCWSYDDEEMVDLWHRAHAAWAEQSATPYELIERIRSGEPVEAHNAGFEFNIWNISLRREFPEFDVEIKPEQLYCSAAKASCVSLPRSLGDAVNAVGLLERKLADGRRLINKLSKPMPRRNIIVTPGDPWKKVVRAEVYSQFEMDAIITNEQVYDIAEAIALEHDEAPDAIREAVRNLFVREVAGNQSRPATMERLSDGVYKWIAKPIMPKMLGTIQVVEKGPLLFCEEEVEHRKNWEYCKQDVRAERALSKFCPEMSERERDFWLMDFRMNLRGITLDHQAVAVAMDLATKEADQLNERLSDLTSGKVRKGSQRIPLLAWANGRLTELGLPTLENTKADTLSFALDGVPTKAGDEARDAQREPMRQKWEPLGQEGAYLAEALRICMEVNRSSVAKYKRMQQCVCSDGRIHDIMLYNGADRTGRWSGKGIQPHNFVRGYSKYMTDVWHDLIHEDRDFIEMVWEEPMVALAKACRGALIASPGKELYAADFNAIEARKLAWMSGCAPLLTLFNTPGGDPYIDMAEAIYNRKLNKKDNPNERQLGKKAILGLGYAMGWEKFQATVWAEEGIWLEDEFCQLIVNIYRKKKYPEVPMLWKASEMAAISAVVEGGEHWAGGGASTVTLSPEDAAWAIDVGTRRTQSSRSMGIARNKYRGTVDHGEREGLRRDVYGAAAELAFCRAMGLEWPAHVDTFKTEPDVYPNWEVQCGGSPSYNLIWRDDQNRRDRNYALVTTVANTLDPEDPWDFRFQLRGYWEGSKTPKGEWRNDARIGLGNAKIPQSALTSFGLHGPGAVSYFMSEDRNFLHCRLPSGRLLAYLYPQVHSRVTYRFAALNERGGNTTVSFPAKKNVPMHKVRWHAEKQAVKQRKRLIGDAPESFISPHLSFMGRDTYTKQWKRCGTHGGTLVENFDQASSRDLLAEAMYRIDQTDDFDLLLSIHDEAVAEAPIGRMSLKDFEGIMAIVPDWAPNMPITAEGWIGPRLRK